MFAPAPRLIALAALVVIPAGAMPAAHSVLAPYFYAIAGIALVAAILDAISSIARLDDLCVQTPAVVRLTKDREGTVPVTLRRTGARRLPLRIAVDLPVPFRHRDDSLRTVFPENVAAIRIDWACTPALRGRYAIGGIYLETPSRLGLWEIRRPAAVSGEIRVYPNLHRDYSRLAAVFLRRGVTGIHARRFLGRGREFAKLREYVPGDSFEDIHWKATARRRHPITKEYQIEKTQEIYVAIDTSRLSARAVREPGGEKFTTPIEGALSAALILALAAERQGDLFGLISFSDRVDRFVPARGGKSHFGICRDALYTLTPGDVTPDFDDVCAFIRLRLRKRALIVFLTALDDPVIAEGFQRGVELLSRQHLVLALSMATDDIKPMFSGENVRGPDDVYERLAGHIRWTDLGKLKTRLHRQNVHFAAVPHADTAAELVSQYMNLKQRQLL